MAIVRYSSLPPMCGAADYDCAVPKNTVVSHVEREKMEIW